MQEEILQLYEKIKDQLSEEEFNAEIEELRENYSDIGFMDDIDLARMILENHGVDVKDINSTSQKDSSPEANIAEIQESDDSQETEKLTMTDEIREFYSKVEDKVSEEQFLERMEQFKDDNSEISFMGPVDFAKMVVSELEDKEEEVEVISERPENADKFIKDLEDGSKDVSVSGRVISISNKRSFKTRKGKEGEVCNVELQDNTGTMRCVFWTQNMPLLKKFKEGDVIEIKGTDIKDGFSGLEATLRPRSTIVHIEDDASRFPEYKETITDIADIKPETKVNIIARILRIPTIRSYEKNGKQGKVASLELQDATGKVTYTLWNKNVELIEKLKLEDGDTVKILAAQARERLNRDGEAELSLTHWDGRIIKGDYDVPEIVQEFSQIGDLSEQKDVSIKGVVVRLQDIKTFLRKKDNTEGRLRNFDVGDSTGSTGDTGLIPGWGTKMLKALQHGQKEYDIW